MSRQPGDADLPAAAKEWTAAGTALNQLTAELWVAALTDAGIPAMLHPGDVTRFLGMSTEPVRVMVPAGALETARAILGEIESDLLDPPSDSRGAPVTDLLHLFRRDAQHADEPTDVRTRELPADLWVRCDQCRELLYVKDFERALKVCGRCGHHARLGARERLDQLLDDGVRAEDDAGLRPSDPLEFAGRGQSYREKLVETQDKTKLSEAAMCMTGTLEGAPVRIVAMDFGFMGASMGSVVGEKVARAAERSAQDGRPLIVVSASGGARMHEGIFSLMQMAKTAAALGRLGERGVPFISVLTDPTTGGVTASFAGLGDVLIAEPGALVGFAGPRVIEQITRQKLPPGAQRAEFLMEHGLVDMVVPRRDLKRTLGRLLALYAPRPAAVAGRA